MKHSYEESVDEAICHLDFSLLRTIVRGVSTESHGVCAQLLVPMLSTQAAGYELLKALLNSEVEQTKQAECLFREETIASKVLSEFAKKFGTPYIQAVVHPVIADMVKSKKRLEVDPLKLHTGSHTDPASIEKRLVKNRANLQHFVGVFLEKIFSSAEQLPPVLIAICQKLTESVGLKYEESCMMALSGFIFLRFVCPSVLIVDPNVLANYCKDKGSATKLRRGLMLITKALQNLANGVGFNESYMQYMNEFVMSQIENRNKFFSKVLSLSKGYPIAGLRQLCIIEARKVFSQTEVRNDLERFTDEVIQRNWFRIKKQAKIDATSNHLKKFLKVLPNSSKISEREAALSPPTSPRLRTERSNPDIVSSIQKDYHSWQNRDVASWLVNIHLDELRPLFIEQRITGDKLPMMSTYEGQASTIPELTKFKLRERKALKNEVTKLIMKTTSSSSSESDEDAGDHSFDVPQWLKSLGLEELTPLFVQHSVSLKELASLDEKDLVDIGVTALGTRKKLLRAIKSLPPPIHEMPLMKSSSLPTVAFLGGRSELMKCNSELRLGL